MTEGDTPKTTQEIQKSAAVSERTSEVNGALRKLSELVSTAPNVDERIQNIRDKIAADPEKVAQIKQEIATKKQEYLHEMSLSQARLLHSIFTIVSERPLITQTELIAKVKESADITNPKLMQDLIQVLDQMTRVLRKFKDISGAFNSKNFVPSGRRVRLVKQLFSKKSSLSNQEINTLAGSSMEMEISSFGVVLYVKNPKAFALIDQRTNVGGFFQKEQTFKLDESWKKADQESITLPLIVVKGENNKVFEHEVGHSVANMLKQTLLGIQEAHSPNDQPESWTQTGVRTPKTKVVDIIWGQQNSLDDAKEIAKKLTTHSSQFSEMVEQLAKLDPDDPKNKSFIEEQKVEQTKRAENENKLVEYALQCAKDELLAEMYAERGDIVWHLDNLKEKAGLYDYFKNRLSIDVSTPLYTRLWNTYLTKLTAYTETAFALHKTYQEDALWNKRVPLLRYMLLVTPIEKWESQLDRLGYVEEIKLHTQLHEKIEQTMQRINRVSFLRNGHVLSAKYFSTFKSELQRVRFTLDKEIIDSANHSTLSLTRQAHTEVDALIAEFDTSEEGKILAEIIETSDTMIEIRQTLEAISKSNDDLVKLCSYLQNELSNIKIVKKITPISTSDIQQTSKDLRPILDKLRDLNTVVQYLNTSQDIFKEINNKFLDALTPTKPATTVRTDRADEMMQHFDALADIRDDFLASLPRPYDTETVLQKINEYIASQQAYINQMEALK